MNTSDEFLEVIRDLGIEPTRQNYIDFIWLGEPPDPWTADNEAELPKELQDWSVFAEEKDLGQ